VVGSLTVFAVLVAGDDPHFDAWMRTCASASGASVDAQPDRYFGLSCMGGRLGLRRASINRKYNRRIYNPLTSRKCGEKTLGPEKLTLGGCGGVRVLLLLLALLLAGTVGRFVVREGYCGADDEGEAQHQAHEFFHCCQNLLLMVATFPSTSPIMASRHELALKALLKYLH
jgi:hypothetical protein